MQRQLGMARQEVRQRRHHEMPRQRALQVDAQQPLGRRVAEQPLGLLHVGQQAHATAVVGLAVLREAHGARGALEQPRADALLDALDQVGDGGARNLEVFRGLGEALALGDAHEGLHFLEAVHGDAVGLLLK